MKQNYVLKNNGILTVFDYVKYFYLLGVLWYLAGLHYAKMAAINLLATLVLKFQCKTKEANTKQMLADWIY